MANFLEKKAGIANAATLAAFVTLFLWSAYAVFATNQVSIYAENGLLESLQVFLLLVACLLFLAPVALAQRPDKLLLSFCSLLCFAFFLREVDVEKLDVPGFLKALGSGTGRNLTLAVGFAAIVVLAVRQFTMQKQLAAGFLKTKPGLLLMAGGMCLVAGELFEKYVAITHHVYFEEMLELFGYVLILLSALAAKVTLPYLPTAPTEPLGRV